MDRWSKDGVWKSMPTMEGDNIWVSGIKVMRSNAGFYIGTSYKECIDSVEMPYSRVSQEYFETEDQAISALITGKFTKRDLLDLEGV